MFCSFFLFVYCNGILSVIDFSLMNVCFLVLTIWSFKDQNLNFNNILFSNYNLKYSTYRKSQIECYTCSIIIHNVEIYMLWMKWEYLSFYKGGTGFNPHCPFLLFQPPKRKRKIEASSLSKWCITYLFNIVIVYCHFGRICSPNFGFLSNLNLVGCLGELISYSKHLVRYLGAYNM